VSSSFSAGGNCVEAGVDQERRLIAVRNSKDPARIVIWFGGAEWDAFLDGAKAGEFDSTRLFD
jgi:hypothetical protein